MSEYTMTVDAANIYVKNNAAAVNAEYRPAFHAAPPLGWINDPNGFVYFRGRYHLFCQYHPYSSQWGPMHWGHWVSEDLVDWQWLGVALAPDTPADEGGCFSGTAVVWNNCLYLMYTGLSKDDTGRHCQLQCIAYSQDGFTFLKNPDNPVISAAQLPDNASVYEFRDPKLFMDVNGRWRAIVANQTGKEGQLLMFASSDLCKWHYDGVFLADFPQMIECPDFFFLDDLPVTIISVMRMPADQRRYPHDQPALLLRGRLQADELRFVETERYTLDNGWDFYAPQTTRAPDGRRLMIGWLQCWAHHMPTDYLGQGWNGCMSLVRELYWYNGRLYQRPVRELEKLRGSCQKTCAHLSKSSSLVLKHSDCAEILINLSYIDTPLVKLHLFEIDNEYLMLTYQPAQALLTVDGSNCGYPVHAAETDDSQAITQVDVPLTAGKLKLRIYLDSCSAEIFVNEGETVISSRVFPKAHGKALRLAVPDGTCNAQLTVYDLKVHPFGL